MAESGRADDQLSARGPHFPVTVIGRIGDEDEPKYGLRIPKHYNDPMASAATSDKCQDPGNIPKWGEQQSR